MKRLFDVVVSVTALIVLAPAFLLIYGLVRRDSPGGGFFRQIRLGQHGKPFSILKFRTMTISKGSESGSFDAGKSDRITNIGRVLRKYKIDELPQLINVLKGDMSLVGPRPEVRRWVEAYPQQWARVHRVRPGITDPASIKFRDEESILARYEDPVSAYRDVLLPQKLSLYEDYVQNRSFWGDIKIIFQTFTKIFAG